MECREKIGRCFGTRISYPLEHFTMSSSAQNHETVTISWMHQNEVWFSMGRDDDGDAFCGVAPTGRAIMRLSQLGDVQ
jgi:hypothetical protein